MKTITLDLRTKKIKAISVFTKSIFVLYEQLTFNYKKICFAKTIYIY
jgi:hypothetical protein